MLYQVIYQVVGIQNVNGVVTVNIRAACDGCVVDVSCPWDFSKPISAQPGHPNIHADLATAILAALSAAGHPQPAGTQPFLI